MTSYELISPDKSVAVEWDCGFRNPASDSVKLRVFEVLSSESAGDSAVCLLYASILANTRDIQVTCTTGTPPDQITSLEKFWGWCKINLLVREDGETISVVDNPAVILKSYQLFERWVSNDLQVIWAEAYNKAQVMFPARDIYKPDALIDPDKLKDAVFLVNGGQG